MAFKKVSFLKFKFEIWCVKIATQKHERKEKSIKVRTGIPTLTAAIEVTNIYHCTSSGTDGFG